MNDIVLKPTHEACHTEIVTKSGEPFCEKCQTALVKKARCPDCGEALEKLAACGSVSFFCNTCNALRSKSEVITQYVTAG